MASFIQTLRPTAFGYYDSDPLFQRDADAMVTFILRRLGEDVLGVELTKKMIWMAFEEATRKLNSLFVEYQANSNLANLLGSPTGSLDQNGNNVINLSSIYVQQNLQFLSDLAAPYSALIGYGNFAENYSGSIVLENGRQDYDLYTELKDDTATPLFNLQPSGSIGKMQVYEVFHLAPVQYVFNSNIASNFIAHHAQHTRASGQFYPFFGSAHWAPAASWPSAAPAASGRGRSAAHSGPGGRGGAGRRRIYQPYQHGLS